MAEPTLLSQVDALLQKTEALPDPAVRALLGDAVRALMDLHGEGLSRIMEHLASLGEVGTPIVDALVADEMVSGLLLLYGLHPQDLPTRVRAALDEVAPSLASHGGTIELLGVADDGTVRVALHVSGHGCGSTAAKLKASVEQAIYDHAPDVAAIHVQEDPASTGFVSLSSLVNSAARIHMPEGAST